MDLPYTSHRRYYRRRANPRALRDFPTGGVREACRPGSRWHRFAFTKADEGKAFEAIECAAATIYICLHACSTC